MARQGKLRIEGEERSVSSASLVMLELLNLARKFGRLRGQDVEEAISAANGHDHPGDSAALDGDPLVRARQHPVAAAPRTDGQRAYVGLMAAHDLVFAVGPAGTGKTFLAVAQAIEALREGRVRKIVLTRPAVEAGERLGFLPGDFQAKVNPYLRPLYDALNIQITPTQMRRYVDLDVIEIAPLAYMRGRTLEHAFIILDEGQNTTAVQMKMFLTRLGQSSRVVVTGDITQIDLGRNETSGLVEALAILRDVPGIGFAFLTERDIVRHPLVAEIVAAYGRREAPAAAPAPVSPRAP
ncbi:MAG: PhoH family protein [Planctomycetes bacterium]|nr:PhoH family protein [Planctomycetota bacterium]